MKENSFLILTGGDISENQLLDFMSMHKDISIICVDGALELADRLGLIPDYLVGDFDTISSEIIQKYRNQVKRGEINTKIYTFCPEKDETDTQIAISLAVEKEAASVSIFGAVGSRMDHTIANIQLLKQLLIHEIDAYIINEHNRIYLKDKSFDVEKKKVFGTYFSLIPFDGTVKDVTLTGFKYNTDSVDFQIGSSLGVSNELLKDKGNVRFTKGTFLVIEAND